MNVVHQKLRMRSRQAKPLTALTPRSLIEEVRRQLFIISIRAFVGWRSSQRSCRPVHETVQRLRLACVDAALVFRQEIQVDDLWPVQRHTRLGKQREFPIKTQRRFG